MSFFLAHPSRRVGYYRLLIAVSDWKIGAGAPYLIKKEDQILAKAEKVQISSLTECKMLSTGTMLSMRQAKKWRERALSLLSRADSEKAALHRLEQSSAELFVTKKMKLKTSR